MKKLLLSILLVNGMVYGAPKPKVSQTPKVPITLIQQRAITQGLLANMHRFDPVMPTEQQVKAVMQRYRVQEAMGFVIENGEVIIK